MQVFSQTDIGLHRSSNQDCCETGTFPDQAVWAIVCDGMGGANGGSTASRVAVDTIAETFRTGYRTDFDESGIRELMEIAVRCANQAVYDMATHVPGLDGMGTTVVCAIVRSGMAHILHAGDSRAYICTETGVRQITTDHSIVQELVAAGRITPEQARNHPNRNIITRALGTEPELITDNTTSLRAGAKLVICTDGMSNYITEDRLYSFIRSIPCDELTDKLIESAKELGGSDNITVAVIAG